MSNLLLNILLITLAGTAVANECTYSQAIADLMNGLKVNSLHNCTIEIVEDTEYVHDLPQSLLMIYAEDRRLNTNSGIDMWSTHPCKYKYDEFKDVHYFYDDRYIGKEHVRRFVKYRLGQHRQVLEFEVGRIELITQKWLERALCKKQFVEDYL